MSLAFALFSVTPPLSNQGMLKGITVLLTSCLTGLDYSVVQINKKLSSHTADSKPVKQEVNSTVILPPLVFPGLIFASKARTVSLWSAKVLHFGRL